MWEEGVRIYDTPGVHNNFSYKVKVFKILMVHNLLQRVIPGKVINFVSF